MTMPDLQKITDAKGEVTHVVLPVDEWEDLIDALEVNRLSGLEGIGEEGEIIPSEFAHRLIDDENPVRVWRQFRTLSQKQLAEKSGLDQSTISDIERGKRTGSIGVLKSIANSLNISLDDLA
jgi:DNA-binding XRE family transcriptional regulator